MLFLFVTDHVFTLKKLFNFVTQCLVRLFPTKSLDSMDFHKQNSGMIQQTMKSV